VPTGDGKGYTPHRQQYDRSIYWALTEGTATFVAEKLQRIGFTGKSMGQLDPSHPQHQSFVGQQVDLWCSHEDNNKDGVREKWDLSRELAAIEYKPLDSKQVRQLDSLFGRALSQKPAAKPVPAVVGDSDGDPGITDDDIPF
jgi:hypothetical protein